MKKKILFLGSKPIGYFCLNNLIENCENYNIEIIGVLTNNTNRMGETNIIKLCNLNHITLIDKLDDILNIECDFIISVQFHKILLQKHINIAKITALNLHMAPLPEYRGCNQFTFAIIDDKKEFGTTIHVMEEGIDSGPIIAENRFKIPQEINVSELYKLTFKASCKLFSNSIYKILSNELDAIEQSELVNKRGSSTYYRKDIESVKNIDLDWPKEKIWKYIRATSMPGFSPPYTIINNKKINLIIE